MIKRILVALDMESDTPVATRYAVEIGKRYQARLTGLAVVDMGSIEASSIGGGIGTMYYADKLREQLTDDAREKALALTEQFARDSKGVEHIEMVEEGVPFKRIVEDMKFHDLLVVGDDPHFFYSHPKSRTDTLTHVVENTIGPTLVVNETYREVRRVLVAYDGSSESARAMRRFATLAPFGTDLNVTVVMVHDGDVEATRFLLSQASSYLEAHGFSVTTSAMEDKDAQQAILTATRTSEADLIVAGVHTKRTLTGKKLGHITEHLLKDTEIPVFMDH